MFEKARFEVRIRNWRGSEFKQSKQAGVRFGLLRINRVFGHARSPGFRRVGWSSRRANLDFAPKAPNPATCSLRADLLASGRKPYARHQLLSGGFAYRFEIAGRGESAPETPCSRAQHGSTRKSLAMHGSMGGLPTCRGGLTACRIVPRFAIWPRQRAYIGIRSITSKSADMPATLQKIEKVLVAAGVEFIDENGGGPGVRLRKRQKKPK